MTEQDQLDRQTDGETPDAEGQDHLVDSRPERTAEQLQSALEALLLIAEEPVSETDLAAALGTPVAAVSEALAALVRFYDETGRGFELRSVAGGWRYYTREEHADLIGSYVLEGQQGKLSRAALETLAVVAYLQPVGRSRVSAVRGVNVDGVMRTLANRDLIAETGEEESGATLFATTDYFLERMGLDSLDQLPEMAPHLPEVDDLEAELGQLAVVPEQSEPHPHEQDQQDQQHEQDQQDEQDQQHEQDQQDEQDQQGEAVQAELDQPVPPEEVRDEGDLGHDYHPEGEADR